MNSLRLSQAFKASIQSFLLTPPSAENQTWTPQLCKELLKEDEDLLEAPKDASSSSSSSTSSASASASSTSSASKYPGVPARPFSSAMANNVSLWIEKEAFPFKHIPFPLLKEKEVYFSRLAEMQEEVFQMNRECDLQDLEGQNHVVSEFLKKLSLRDVLSLLGMRQTEGSLNSFPPSLKECDVAFNLLHKPETASVLTVGAKALTKHCHRDETASWWGKVTGSEGNKNKLSNEVVQKILSNVVWMNIHQLPHNIRIFEIRHEDGYGARWGMVDQSQVLDGAEVVMTQVDFRGFLEPQMEDGHSVGWRH